MSSRADWDADSPELERNLREVVDGLAADAARRRRPSLAMARAWHRRIMRGLAVPAPNRVGRFRGEAGLEDVGVEVAGLPGAPPERVADELAGFEARLQEAVSALDGLLPPGAELTADALGAVLDLCAWAHAEWVRIHPFANGNGRTARLWANFLAMRYGLPPFVRPRPRPGGDYGAAARAAMRGEWHPTVAVFRRMLRERLQG